MADNAWETKTVWEGRMGNNQTKTYDVYVNGKMVGFSKRKWLADAIGKAVFEGKIEGTGDTTQRLCDWAIINDRPLYERICNSGE